MNADEKSKIFDAFPALLNADAEIQNDFFKNGRIIRLSNSDFVCLEGDSCSLFAFLLSGTVRVYKVSENGREITLYRIEKGESCILTASCILSDKQFPAYAIAENELEAVAVSAETFNSWVKRYPFWQNYVFNLVSKRLGSIIAVVEEVAFNRVDTRIANYLSNFGVSVIKKTHQEIGAEVGTAREVVSRILKDFEHENLISLSRGEIHILQPALIEKKAGIF